MNGTPIPEVSAMLGHANVNITLTVCTHFIPKMRTDSTERFAASIFNKKNPFDEGVVHIRPLVGKKQKTASQPTDELCITSSLKS